MGFGCAVAVDMTVNTSGLGKELLHGVCDNGGSVAHEQVWETRREMGRRYGGSRKQSEHQPGAHQECSIKCEVFDTEWEVQYLY